KPNAFALSHNALGKGEVRGRRYVVTEIPEVRSVDIVTDGGTNRSLFESRQEPMKIKVRKLFEAAGPKAKPNAKKQPRLAAFMKRLLEGDDFSAVMDAETDGEAPPEHEAALKDGFRAAISHLVDACPDGEEDPKECLKKIKEMVNAHGKLAGSDEEDVEESDDESGGAVAEDDKKKEEAKKTEESRKHCVRLAKGFLALQEKQEPAKSLVEALCKLPDDDARLSLLESWPKGTGAQQTGRNGSAPRSASPGRPIQESAVPSTAEEQATLLLR
ncbi:MAG TPA: hypothetical protein VM711_02850, partial [Sphingomicrobium sp.]|nr:hypothetical protein [Sphingomicrobium sp.]